MDEESTSSSSGGKHRTEADHRRRLARRKMIRQYLIIAISSLVFVGVMVAAVIGTHVSNKVDPNTSRLMNLATTVKAVCNVTLYKDTCYESLMSSDPKTGKPDELFQLSMLVSRDEIDRASHELVNGAVGFGLNDTMLKQAVQNCVDLLGLAVDQVNDSMALPTDLSNISTVNDLKTWLSAAGTCHGTCLDGFELASEDVRLNMSKLLKRSSELTSNSLAIANWLSSVAGTVHYKQRRRLMSGDVVEPE